MESCWKWAIFKEGKDSQGAVRKHLYVSILGKLFSETLAEEKGSNF